MCCASSHGGWRDSDIFFSSGANQPNRVKRSRITSLPNRGEATRLRSCRLTSTSRCGEYKINFSHFKTEDINFEVADSFTYLDSEMSNRNECTSDIQKIIIMANRCLNGIRKYMKSNLIERKIKGAVGSLVVRASDPRPETRGRCPMPPNTLRVHTEHVLVKSVGPKSCGLSHERRGLKKFGEFRRAKSYCHLKMERGEENQISRSINHIKNLTLTSSKYNGLNGQLALSEWTKTVPLKQSSMPHQLAHG
ncbi:hypothetical protein TNCV_1053771 [Trichonephila clavipes]|nr:hypothetical protein TNCV_1053771 [Trichonephila clavipes]